MKRFCLACALLMSLLTASAFAQDVTAGVDAYGRGDYAAALAAWRPLAERGDGDAQASLGLLYARGQGVRQDYAEAIKWFQLSATQGYAIAQNNLGVMYRNGYGVRQDYELAAMFYLLSAAQGYALAQHSLGAMYENGEGIRPDYEEAYMWYTLAAEQGHAGAKQDRQSLSVLISDAQRQQALVRVYERKARSERERPAKQSVPADVAASEPLAEPEEDITRRPPEDSDEVVASEPPEEPEEIVSSGPSEEPGEVATNDPPEEPEEVATAEPPKEPDEVAVNESLAEPKEVAASGQQEEAPENISAPPPAAPLNPPVEVAAKSSDQPPAKIEDTAWRVQLRSMRKQEETAAAWAELRQANEDLLGALELHVQLAELSNGTFYRVQAGPLADRATAISLCDTLKARSQDCLIVAP